MKANRKSKKLEEMPDKEIIRASISFPAEDYEKLEQAAARKRVSLAWVVREAVREYLTSNSTSSEGE